MTEESDVRVVVDVGNSHTSAALFQRGEWRRPLKVWRCEPGAAWPPEAPLPTRAAWWVASVNAAARDRLRQEIQESRPQDAWRDLRPRDFPLDLRVLQPDRVGADRVAAAAAANRLRDPMRPAVIVDSGSAVTVDLVEVDGGFLGGAIFPGMAMSAFALTNETDLLPSVLPPVAPPDALGRSTVEAIRSGLYWGTLGAIRELVAQFSARTVRAPEIFVTGGGALWAVVSEEARLERDLVLCGVALAACHCESELT